MLAFHMNIQSPPLLDDSINRQILRWALGLKKSPIPTRNFYVAPLSGEVLKRCHAMADAGLMYFRPTEEELTCFLVTESGAMALDTHLDKEDAFFMQTFFELHDTPMSEYAQWRLDVREAHLAGTEPPPYHPEAHMSRVHTQSLSHTQAPAFAM